MVVLFHHAGPVFARPHDSTVHASKLLGSLRENAPAIAMANYTQHQVDAYMSNFTPEEVDAYVDSQPPGFLEEDQSYRIIAVGVAFIVLETLVTILRAFARGHLKQLPFMRADTLAILSLVANLSVCTAVMRKRLGPNGTKRTSG